MEGGVDDGVGAAIEDAEVTVKSLVMHTMNARMEEHAQILQQDHNPLPWSKEKGKQQR